MLVGDHQGAASAGRCEWHEAGGDEEPEKDQGIRPVSSADGAPSEPP